jgi:tetratricopeptide (TPR) repeat protein
MGMAAGLPRYRTCLVAVGTVLACSAFDGRAAADDGNICAEESGDVAIAACTRAIKSGKYTGHSLALKYSNRGVEWKLKKDYERALADYGTAIRLDATYADAFYNRCIIYNIKEDFDRALADCTRAVKLGPSPDAMSSTGAQRLGDDRTSSDYYAQRGFAYLGKKNFDLAIADYDKAIRLNPNNAKAVSNRGLAYQGKGDTTRANADFEAARQIGK